MKKIGKILIACILAIACLFSVTACGNTNEENKPKPKPGPSTTGITADIDFYTTVNIIEQSALETVASAYMDLQYAKGNKIRVEVINNTDPSGYTNTVRNLVSGGVDNPSIVQTSVASEYYGTDKYIDFAAALEEPNPYIEGNEAWRDALEEDAYRYRVAGSKTVIPGLSYSADYTTVFYNKKAMRAVADTDSEVAEAVSADGTLIQDKITWSWMMKALEAAKKSGLNFKNPLGLSTSPQSCGEDSFNMLSRIVNTYLDQYFRDFINEAHSQEGDYSYIESVDGKWQYDTNNAGLDLYGTYTYNINRVVDAFFNNAKYAPTSDRYTEVMQNLYDMMRYADSEAAYIDIFSRFNETTIVFENKGGSYNDMKLFYVEDLSYVRTYRDAFKTQSGGRVVYPSAAQISSELGWFSLPAMASTLDGVADNVRPVGGPKENYGIINTGDNAKNDIALDFMMYLYSPAGQAAIFSKYKSDNNAPITMRQLVKGVTIPSEIDFTKLITAKGNCDNTPYLLFGKGGDMSTLKSGSSADYVKDRIGAVISNYFRGSTRSWNGTPLFDEIKAGFGNYAADRNFIYTDYRRVGESTNGLKNSPYNTSN